MNIRFSEGELRIRLSDHDHDNLRNKGLLRLSYSFPAPLSIELLNEGTESVPAINWISSESILQIKLSPELLKALKDAEDKKTGLSYVLSIPEAETIKLVLQIDKKKH